MAYHTSEPENPEVYHTQHECSEGRKILPQHRVDGEGIGRRLCEVCASMA